jgi:hypothetical protein
VSTNPPVPFVVSLRTSGKVRRPKRPSLSRFGSVPLEISPLLSTPGSTWERSEQSTTLLSPALVQGSTDPVDPVGSFNVAGDWNADSHEQPPSTSASLSNADPPLVPSHLGGGAESINALVYPSPPYLSTFFFSTLRDNITTYQTTASTIVSNRICAPVRSACKYSDDIREFSTDNHFRLRLLLVDGMRWCQHIPNNSTYRHIQPSLLRHHHLQLADHVRVESTSTLVLTGTTLSESTRTRTH